MGWEGIGKRGERDGYLQRRKSTAPERHDLHYFVIRSTAPLTMNTVPAIRDRRLLGEEGIHIRSYILEVQETKKKIDKIVNPRFIVLLSLSSHTYLASYLCCTPIYQPDNKREGKTNQAKNPPTFSTCKMYQVFEIRGLALILV